MVPMLSTLNLTRRASYVLSGVLMGLGWLCLLALTLNWPSSHWSRPALALQAAAFAVALVAVRHIPFRRFVIYPLILGASIYLLDTTLPPPNLPSGWPREIIPRLVLMGLLVDSVRTIRWGRRGGQAAGREFPPIALDDAARLLGLTAAELRVLLQQRRLGIAIDIGGREYLSVEQLWSLQRARKPSWWQLYGGVLFLNGVLFILPVLIPPAWEVAAMGVWCFLTLGGMWAWIWMNRDELRDEDRSKQQGYQRDKRRDADEERSVPLTPVQERYLAVIGLAKGKSQQRGAENDE